MTVNSTTVHRGKPITRVLLVNPDSAAQEGYSNPPLGLAYLAGTLERHGIQVRIVDGFLVGRIGIEQAVREFDPGLVGITCYTPGRTSVIDIAKWVKTYRRDMITVLGGPHATIMWKQIMINYQQVDMCVLGEGEQTLLEIVLGTPYAQITGVVWRNDDVVTKNLPRKYIENLDFIPFPAWHLLPLHQYPNRGSGVHNGIDLSIEPRISVVFSRGCSASCSFCSTWWIWRGHRCRSAANMADELELLNQQHGFRHIIFADDAFSADMLAAKTLCQEIITRRIKIAWLATTRVDAVDHELLQLMRESGCYEISYGVESGSQRILDLMGKKATVQQAKEAIIATKETGIRATVLLIVGNEGETSESVNETVDFLNDTDPDNIGSVGGLWIFPGTALYTRAKREKLIDDSFWLTDEPIKVYLAEHSEKDLRKYLFAIQSRKKIGSVAFWLAYAIRLSRSFARKFAIARKIYNRVTRSS